MRKLLLCLTGDPSDGFLMEKAFDFASELSAFVLAFYPNVSPSESWENRDVSMVLQPLALSELPSSEEEAQEDASSDQHYQILRQRFAQMAQNYSFSWREAPRAETLPAAWMLPYDKDIPSTALPDIALADLVIFSHTYQKNARGWSTIESIMMDARRLVLVLSLENPFKTQGGTSYIAWDGSVQASRSLVRAIPFLQRSERIFLLCIDGAVQEPVDPTSALRYLALYGITAEIVRCCPAKENAEGIGRAILDQATTGDANLLIMGGYGSSGAFMELLVGGVTQYVRAHTTVNLLMTH